MRRLLILLIPLIFASAAYGSDKVPTDWAWDKIKAGQIADFNELCGKLDPRKEPGWDDGCRRIPARFLDDVLIDPKLQAQVPHHIVQLRGVRIDGAIDLSGADINAVLRVDASRIEGKLNLDDSHWTRVFALEDSVVAGGLTAKRMHNESSLLFRDARFDDDVDLTGAKVDGQVDMAGATFAKTLRADSLSVGSDLFMRNGATFNGDVSLSGAKVDGELDMTAASLAKALNADSLSVGRDLFMRGGATFNGDVTLLNAKVGGQADMYDATFAKSLNVADMSVGSDLFMRNGATFNGDVNMIGAKIGGELDMTGATFAKVLFAADVRVGSDLFMRNGATFGGDVNLIGAKVEGQVDMTGAAFAKTLNADSMSVGRDLFLRDKATFSGDVILLDARIGGQVDMFGATFANTLNGDSLRIGSDLFMRNGATFNGDVDLIGAKIDGELDMTRATFAKALNADSLTVGSSLNMDNGATFSGDVDLRSAQIGALYLNGAIAAHLDLSGASITQELNVAGLGWQCNASGAKPGVATGPSKAPTAGAPMHWLLGDPAWQHAQCGRPDGSNTPPWLSLRNVHAGTLQDSADAWPPAMDLEGFRYDRIGGLGGTGSYDMRARSPEQWADWLARDTTFSTQPNAQLAGTLLAAGHRDTAERIEFVGREREREAAGARGDWLQWGWLSFLCFIAGYGIGLYTFRVLWWVLALTALGAAVLWFSPQARRRGVVWRLGASLHRLLPVVELNKEFSDFFENPAPPHVYERRNLSPIQAAFFSGLAIAGWVLGFFLIAALGGLMPKG